LTLLYKQRNEEYSRLEVSIKNYENEVRTVFSTSDQNLANLKRENEDLKKRIADMENRLALVSQEL
jgi:uncharacterized membrane-anchored protein YhcB (DUF1043 family)